MLVKTREDFNLLLREVMSEHILSIDTETTGLVWKVDTVVGISIGTEKLDFYIPLVEEHREGVEWEEKEFIEVLNNLFLNPIKYWIIHNAAFDLHTLTELLKKHNLTFELKGRFFDTKIVSWLIDENMSAGLKSLAYVYLMMEMREFDNLLMETKNRKREERLLQIKAEKEALRKQGMRAIEAQKLATASIPPISKITIVDCPIDQVAHYASDDARATYDLGIVFKRELKDINLYEHYFEEQEPFQRVLYEMETEGFLIDQELLEVLIVEYSQKLDKVTQEIAEETGVYDLNVNSTEQLSKLLFEDLDFEPSGRKTEKGQESVDVKALKSIIMKTHSSLLLKILEYRALSKLKNTYLDGIKKLIINGRLHTEFRMDGTTSSRLSSRKPNLQNLPNSLKDKNPPGRKIRDIFIAPEGQVLVVADLNQGELRVLAHYSEDPTLIKVYTEEGGDIHKKTSTEKNIPRPVAKKVNFGTGYGLGPKSLMEMLLFENDPPIITTIQECKDFINGFYSLYPRVLEWKNEVYSFLQKNGYVVSLDGRMRRLPNIWSDKRIYNPTYKSNYYPEREEAKRQAVNFIIQSCVAVIMRRAMIDIQRKVKPLGATLISQVHDEVILSVPEEKAEEVSQIVKVSLESQVNLKVPMTSEVGYGRTWASAK